MNPGGYDELHYRRLRAECYRWGATEEDVAGLGIEELAELKDRLVRQAMKPGRAA